MYDVAGNLIQHANSSEPDQNADYTYSYDPLNRLIQVDSTTVNPAYPRLGKLKLTYHPNGTPHQVFYTSDENPSVPPSLIYSTTYAYDSLDRRIVTSYISPIPGEPDLIITIDPEIPEDSPINIVQYEYDSLSRRILTMDTSGYFTRTLYYDGSTSGMEEREMLDVLQEEPNEIFVVSYEYENDPQSNHFRSSDLQGRFQLYEYDDNGYHIASGYRDETLGGGGHGGNLAGNILNMNAYGAATPNPDQCLPVLRWDDFGNLTTLIEQREKQESLIHSLAQEGQESDFQVAAKKKKAAKKKEEKKEVVRKKKLLKEEQNEYPMIKEKLRKGCTEILKGDINGDCKVTLIDLSLLGQKWLADKTM